MMMIIYKNNNKYNDNDNNNTKNKNTAYHFCKVKQF